jgi:GT2 family glycosyltransferase
MIDRELWDTLAGFDEAFFMYGEEADLCLRARTRGFRPAITPDAAIVHHGAASEPAEASKLVRLLAAHVLLFRKHWPPLSRRFGVTMLRVWASSRWLVGRALGRLGLAAADARANVWLEVWRRRAEWVDGYKPHGTTSPNTLGAPR